jgi:hypothetical protein
MANLPCTLHYDKALNDIAAEYTPTFDRHCSDVGSDDTFPKGIHDDLVAFEVRACGTIQIDTLIPSHHMPLNV